MDGPTAWLTLDLLAPVDISTIVFLVHRNENLDGFGNMLRTYGTHPDKDDTITNTMIRQAGGTTNFPAMVADLANGNGPVPVQYIHWQADTAFQPTEVLCYSRRRLIDLSVTSG